jgi:hypothetical protein
MGQGPGVGNSGSRLPRCADACGRGQSSGRRRDAAAAAVAGAAGVAVAAAAWRERAAERSNREKRGPVTPPASRRQQQTAGQTAGQTAPPSRLHGALHMGRNGRNWTHLGAGVQAHWARVIRPNPPGRLLLALPLPSISRQPRRERGIITDISHFDRRAELRAHSL